MRPFWIVLCRLLLPLALGLAAAQAREASAPPRLVLWIVIDQMPADVWSRYHAAFSPDGGFARLRAASARWTQAGYEHLVTSTAAGHATLATGASPSRHGVVGNRWYDREREAVTYCVAGGRPDALALPTLADALWEQTRGRARIGAVSGKDRGAILLGGRHPRAVVWFDPRAGRWRGRGEAATLGPLVRLGRRRTLACFGRPWGLFAPAACYPERDDRPYERGPFGLGRRFPHPVDGEAVEPGPAFLAAFSLTPYLDEITLAIAERLLEREGFGRDAVPDLLYVSLSSSDLVSHTFGPHSRETRDVYLRLDALLGRLLDTAERQVGREALLVVLTSDHGGSPIPESFPDGGRVSVVHLLATARRAAREALGLSAPAPPLVRAFCPPHLVLADRARSATVSARVARAIASIEGVQALATSALAGPRPADLDPALWRAARRSVFGDRSGDVLVWLEPHFGWQPGKAAEHGRPVPSDQRVPLWIRAPGLRPGAREGRCAVRRVVAEIARRLGIRPPAGADPGPLPGLR
ncbi:MAG: hypothetical protein D6776_10380 [Planctomycetota bacterium]|nr:MAG: hypothetical protein D6776_10380 [Planctomycetota bacterium]